MNEPALLNPQGVSCGPLEMLRRFFFPLGSTARLAVMRIVAVGLNLVWFMYPLAEHMSLLNGPVFARPMYVTRLVLTVFDEEAVRQPAVLTTLHYFTMAAGLLAVLGCWSRLSVGLHALGATLLVSHIYSYDEFHHKDGIYVMFLWMLAFAPCGDCLSLDAWWQRRKQGTDSRAWWQATTSDLAMWPIVTIQCILAVCYLDAAMSKLLNGGLHWFNGYTMQQKLLTDGVRNGRPLGVWMSQFRLPGIPMALVAVMFEGLFWLVLVPRLRKWTLPVFMTVGVLVHVGIFVLQGAPFFHWLALYLTWVPWERWLSAHDKTSGRAEVRTSTAATG